jgi:hypothetical protein
MSRDVFSLCVAAPRQRWKLVLPLFTNNNNLCCQLIAEFQVWLASVSVSIMFYDALGDLTPRPMYFCIRPRNDCGLAYITRQAAFFCDGFVSSLLVCSALYVRISWFWPSIKS